MGWGKEMSLFNYKRRISRKASIGVLEMGGDCAVRLQSMANVPTMDTDEAIAQAMRIADAGGELVRFTAQSINEAKNLKKIRKGLTDAGYTLPLVADIHFNPAIAEEAARHVEKVRINPGNFVYKTGESAVVEYSDETYAEELRQVEGQLKRLLKICREHGTAIRIGVNHGSLSSRIMSRFGDTPQGMVESCMEFLRICRDENFFNVVVSIKASNTVVMVQTVRLLVKQMREEQLEFPLHLGVTEAGEGEDGRIRSAVGIGALLADGIGDTIRVSLSEEPECEIPVAQKLMRHILKREKHPYIKAALFPDFDPVFCTRRKSRAVGNIGGGNLPVTIAVCEKDEKEVAVEGEAPDYIYLKNRENVEQMLQKHPDQKFIVDEPFWSGDEPRLFPLVPIREFGKRGWNAPLLFVAASRTELSDELVEKLAASPNVVLLLYSNRRNLVGSERGAMHLLMNCACNVPVVFWHRYFESGISDLQIVAACDFGVLLLDGFSDGIMLSGQPGISTSQITGSLYGILQAARARTTKTEYISCPGCGRTPFNLQHSVAEVKRATAHLKGLKIGVMGCIVNGPGEMADADYGYVGAGKGKINLYKGKTCVRKNIPEKEAVDALTALIKENNDWK